MLVLMSADLTNILENCKRGNHANLITIKGVHSIADNETVKWCPFCGSVITTVLEGPATPDRQPQVFTQLVGME